MEELLAKAAKNYIPGTKYWNLDLAGNRSQPNCSKEDLPIIPKNVKFSFSHSFKGKDGQPVILVTDLQKNQTLGWVYSNQIWAEIVFLPCKIYELW